MLKGAGRIDEASTRKEMRKRGSQNCDLARLKVGNVFGRKAPLDFRIASQRAGAGAGNIGQDAVESPTERQLTGIGGYYTDIGRLHQVAQQAGAMRMNVGGDELRVLIVFCEQGSLAAGSSAAVEDCLSVPNQPCD